MDSKSTICMPYKFCKKWQDSWVTSKNEHFYRQGAQPGRWEKVVSSDGQYFE